MGKTCQEPISASAAYSNVYLLDFVSSSFQIHSVRLTKLELKKKTGKTTVGKTTVEELFAADFSLATGNSLKLTNFTDRK